MSTLIDKIVAVAFSFIITSVGFVREFFWWTWVFDELFWAGLFLRLIAVEPLGDNFEDFLSTSSLHSQWSLPALFVFVRGVLKLVLAFVDDRRRAWLRWLSDSAEFLVFFRLDGSAQTILADEVIGNLEDYVNTALEIFPQAIGRCALVVLTLDASAPIARFLKKKALAHTLYRLRVWMTTNLNVVIQLRSHSDP